LWAAIKERDAGAVLESLTRQRSTFTPAQLERALAKEIRNEGERAGRGDDRSRPGPTASPTARPVTLTEAANEIARSPA
jgi:hypothetical protein